MSPETNDKWKRLLEATGIANPFRRYLTSSRPEEGSLDVATGFYGLENPAGGLPGPTMDGPPYTVKDGQLHAVKSAAHAHDRMEERTPFPRAYVDKLQKTVDLLPLKGESYYIPLKKDGLVHGYAQFKRVPNRNGPVLATVLAPHMTPSGENIEHFLKQAAEPDTNATPLASGLFDTDHIDPRPPESSAWKRLHQMLFNQEQGHYALRHAFDGVTTKPRNEVIESDPAPTDVPKLE